MFVRNGTLLLHKRDLPLHVMGLFALVICEYSL